MSTGNGYWSTAIQQAQDERISRLEEEISESKLRDAEMGSDLKLILHKMSSMSEDSKGFNKEVKESLKVIDGRVDVIDQHLVKIDTINETRSKWTEWGGKIVAALLIAAGSGLGALLLEYLKSR